MTNSDLSQTLAIATDIARRAGDVLRAAYDKPRSISYKSEVDLVTQADEESERLIVAALQASFPEHAILAEESGVSGGEAAYVWLVDPLDGTTNFAHGFPMFSVSIALRETGGDFVVGVVYEPLRDEMFAAMRGGGTTLNGKPVSVTGESALRRALVGTGFPYDRHTAANNNSDNFVRFLRKTQGMRRAGSAALDLAYVACGRLDGFWELGLNAWDTAAGILLVREAGGRVTNASGGEEGLHEGSDVVASNGHLHDAMLEVLSGSGQD